MHRILALLVITFTLSACQTSIQPVAGWTDTPATSLSELILVNETSTPPAQIEVPAINLIPITPTNLILPTSTPTFSSHLRPSSPPTATEPPCHQNAGTIEVFQLETDLLDLPLDYRVYLPPCYDDSPDQHYPVLYMIHGQSYTDDQWQRLGAPGIVDYLFSIGEISPFIIVMPRDRTWQEPANDPFGQVLVEELVPTIDATYRTLPDRSQRAVGGLSRGGAWALHLGLNHWQIFGAVGMHSGFAFKSDVSHIKSWLDAIPMEQMPRFFMDVGDKDQPEIKQSATWFEGLLTERGIPHEWYLFPGYHNEDYWSAHVEGYLRWYARDW